MPLKPHGGVLVERRSTLEALGLGENELKSLPQINLDSRELSDLEMIGNGAMSPLTGFMGAEDYESVVTNMHLASGLAWTLPITLSRSGEDAEKIKPGSKAALTDATGKILAVMEVSEKYPFDKLREAEKVFRTTDDKHPGVAYLLSLPETNLAGPVWIISEPENVEFSQYRLTPSQTRAEMEKKGWNRVVGFQTRNPIHRAHEYIQKCALETVDGLLLHPLMGATKQDDIPHAVRMKSYEILFENYYPKDRVMLSIFPAAMRYAGPREAIFHAICRKNYGCTHFIVGRDHAGVGNYYGSFDAQKIFDEFEDGELGIQPMFFDFTFYCKVCGSMASTKTCPHPSEDHLSLSGTKVRQLLNEGKHPPVELTRPEVAEVLIRGLKDLTT